ncbi:MAG TPA: RNA polymerase sigma-70 factor [Flavihumibacter sp.]|jgi:RNA polymerase sigma-70 factor (family 1)
MLQSKLPYEKLSDEELFARVRQEDARAFEVLYDRYWTMLMDMAYRRIQSKQKSEDIIQEIFISLYQKKNSIRFSVSLQAYLVKALKYKILNELRAKLVRERHQQSVFLNSHCKIDFAPGVELKELEDKIHRSAASLPGKCKQVFFLSRYEEESNKNISHRLAISVSTVEKHISKALQKMRKDLTEWADPRRTRRGRASTGV